MIDDPILLEVREAREAYVARSGGDIRAMLRDLKAKQREDEARGVRYVALPPKRIEPVVAGPDVLQGW